MSQKLGEQVGPYFGQYGGRFVPEPLIAALDQLSQVYEEARKDPKFQEELAELHRTYTGRPSIITEGPKCAGAHSLDGLCGHAAGRAHAPVGRRQPVDFGGRICLCRRSPFIPRQGSGAPRTPHANTH